MAGKGKSTQEQKVQAPLGEPVEPPPTIAPADPAAPPAPGEHPDTPPEKRFPIVGIGASAGGLAAFEAFFSGMPADTDPGMAFVLVQHLAPDHKSILCELVRRYTRMQVFEVEDGVVVEPNCAYIIPPNRDMALLDGALHLLDPVELRGHRLPIDYFFRSLAQDQHQHAICIVLSGTGTDGTLGLRAVKGEGGMAMAQNPASTEYGGMPLSAIATGLADYVLPPAEMPAQLIAYATRALVRAPRPVTQSAVRREDDHNKILAILRAQTGHDFTKYKQSTIVRRIERRLTVHQIARLDEYGRYMQQNPDEVDALFRDLLIGVTHFFRDRAAFSALQARAIPRLFAGKPPDAAIRVWVPACSTGEEAYSLAILLQAHSETREQSAKIQVFATDLDSRAIEQARTGVYPDSIAADVSPEHLARYFIHEPDAGTQSVRKGIRDLLVFSEQDVIADPPFSRLDLISCRNLMIYLDGELHKRLIPLFHYALNPGGVLFLGTSETVGEFTDLFEALDSEQKLYLRRDGARGARHPLLRPITSSSAAEPAAPQPPGSAPGAPTPPLRELTERALLQHYSPTGALVNEHGDILYLQGRTGRYLEPAPGEADLNILKMAREGLRRGLTTALHRAVAHGRPVRDLGLQLKTNGDCAAVGLTIVPVAAAPEGLSEPRRFLVILEEGPATAPAPAAIDGAEHRAGTDARIAALQQELRAKEDYLQTTNEELETANEELTASNEEMQSINEELQSTNEELETSKEELQSVNEELATVNTELQAKVAALSRANNDMNNLLAATDIGTIFVDDELRIQRFTPAATRAVNLILSDVGRPLGHLVTNLVGYDRLVADVQAVLDDLAPREVEVQTREGVWYLLSIRPYRTLENVVEGAVIAFSDITTVKRAQARLRDAEALGRLAVVVRDASDAVVMHDLEGNILAWNPAAQRLYGWSEAAALAMNIRDMIPEGQREAALATLKRLGRGEALAACRTQRLTREGRSLDVWLTATALVDAAGELYAISTTEREYGA